MNSIFRSGLISLMPCALLLLGGCFASARHVSAVRPDTVKAYESIPGKYRLSKIILRKPVAYDGSSAAQKAHAEDTQDVFRKVEKSLLKNYPGVFTKDPSARPLTVLVSWSTRYSPKDLMAASSILTRMFFPERVEQETVYYLRVLEDASSRWEDSLWHEFDAVRGRFPQPPENVAAARYSEIKETFLLPFGFFPIFGESDWSKTYCFSRCGKDSPVNNPWNALQSMDCIRKMVFEPKVDGDVMAAAIIKSINRQSHAKEASALPTMEAKR